MRDSTSPEEALEPARPDPLLDEIRGLIEQTRRRVAATVNAGLTLLYWQIGKRIREEVLKGGRAKYGKQIVHALSAQLVAEYGRGFSRRNLFNMIRFVEQFTQEEIVQTLSAQLSWSHLRQPLEEPGP